MVSKIELNEVELPSLDNLNIEKNEEALVSNVFQLCFWGREKFPEGLDTSTYRRARGSVRDSEIEESNDY